MELASSWSQETSFSRLYPLYTVTSLLHLDIYPDGLIYVYTYKLLHLILLTIQLLAILCSSSISSIKQFHLVKSSHNPLLWVYHMLNFLFGL